MLHEDLFKGFFTGSFVELGLRGERAVGLVEGDFVDGVGGRGGFGGFGEVGGGDLEGVEEEAGAAGVEFVGGDAAHEDADGGLDGGAVLGEGEVEA